MKYPFLAVSLLALAFSGCVQEEKPAPADSGSKIAKGDADKKHDNDEVGHADKKSDQDGKGHADPDIDADKNADAAKDDGTTEQPKAVEVADRLDPKAWDHFGDGVKAAGEALTVTVLAAKAKDLQGKKVRLEGDIQAVCKKKGCWMTLSDGTQNVRVKFRDYGFFVPTDADGRHAVLEGTFSVNETSVKELKHLLEDAGRAEDAAKVTKPRVELKVMADGVALKK